MVSEDRDYSVYTVSKEGVIGDRIMYAHADNPYSLIIEEVIEVGRACVRSDVGFAVFRGSLDGKKRCAELEVRVKELVTRSVSSVNS